MDKNRIPNFSGDTNPFMSCLDSHGNYKKVVYKIPVGNISTEEALKKLKEKLKISDLDDKNKDYFIPIRNMKEKTNLQTTVVQSNYMRVVPNSHFWTKLNQIMYSIELQLQRELDETRKNINTVYVGEPLTKEYILIGLNNSIKNGYKIKQVSNMDLGRMVYPIFPSIDEMIEYAKKDYFNLQEFHSMIKSTIEIGLDLTNGLKMNRQDVYKRIDDERDYQDQRWNTNLREGDVSDEEKPVAEWLNYIEYHLSKAKDTNYHLDKETTLAEVRKVAALAVRCIEIHGCPERKQ
jgi:hypothetical protein